MRNEIENIVPGFLEKCSLLQQDKTFNLSQHESEVVVLMLHDFKPDTIASIFSRNIKTVYKHRENSLKKTGCNTLVGMALKLTMFFPGL